MRHSKRIKNESNQLVKTAKNIKMKKQQGCDPSQVADSGVKALPFVVSGRNAVRQIFFRKVADTETVLGVGNVPIIITEEGLKKLIYKGTGVDVKEIKVKGKLGNGNTQENYRCGTVTFSSAEDCTAFLMMLNMKMHSEPVEAEVESSKPFAYKKYANTYNSKFDRIEDLWRFVNLTKEQDHILLKQKRSEAKRPRADEDGWITVTR